MTQCIPTPSVTLGPVGDHDYDLLCQWASSRSFVYASGSRRFVSPAEFKKLVEGSRDNFLIVRSRDGKPLGAVSWRTGQYRGAFEIGTMIGDAALWQSGFGFEAVIALLGLLFDTERAHRVEFICGVFNKPAIQACCSGLVKVEGVLRDYYYLDGQFQDAVICSILRNEYYAMMPPTEVVPSTEKKEARQILRDYLSRNPIAVRSHAAEY